MNKPKFLIAVILVLIGTCLTATKAHANRDLETGTFITRDPAGFVDGPNVYTYVKQNPWTFFDPDGLNGEPVNAFPPIGDKRTVQQIHQGQQAEAKMSVAAVPVAAGMLGAPFVPAVASWAMTPVGMGAATDVVITTSEIASGVEGPGQIINPSDALRVPAQALLKNAGEVTEAVSGQAAKHADEVLGASARTTQEATEQATKGTFPSKADEMTKALGVDPKKVGVTPDGTSRTTWEPNANTSASSVK